MITKKEMSKGIILAWGFVDYRAVMVEMRAEMGSEAPDELTFEQFAAQEEKELVDTETLKTFGPDPKVHKDSQTCLVEFHKGNSTGYSYTLRMPVPDADSQHLITQMQGGYTIRKIPCGYAVDQVMVIQGTVALLREDTIVFDRDATEPGYTTSEGEWAFLDAVWEEYNQMP